MPKPIYFFSNDLKNNNETGKAFLPNPPSQKFQYVSRESETTTELIPFLPERFKVNGSEGQFTGDAFGDIKNVLFEHDPDDGASTRNFLINLPIDFSQLVISLLSSQYPSLALLTELGETLISFDRRPDKKLYCQILCEKAFIKHKETQTGPFDLIIDMEYLGDSFLLEKIFSKTLADKKSKIFFSEASKERIAKSLNEISLEESKKLRIYSRLNNSFLAIQAILEVESARSVSDKPADLEVASVVPGLDELAKKVSIWRNFFDPLKEEEEILAISSENLQYNFFLSDALFVCLEALLSEGKFQQAEKQEVCKILISLMGRAIDLCFSSKKKFPFNPFTLRSSTENNLSNFVGSLKAYLTLGQYKDLLLVFETFTRLPKNSLLNEDSQAVQESIYHLLQLYKKDEINHEVDKEIYEGLFLLFLKETGVSEQTKNHLTTIFYRIYNEPAFPSASLKHCLLTFYQAELFAKDTAFNKLKNKLTNKKFFNFKVAFSKTLNLDIDLASRELWLCPQYEKLEERLERESKSLQKSYTGLLTLAPPNAKAELNVELIIKILFNQRISIGKLTNAKSLRVRVIDPTTDLSENNLCSDDASEPISPDDKNNQAAFLEAKPAVVDLSQPKKDKEITAAEAQPSIADCENIKDLTANTTSMQANRPNSLRKATSLPKLHLGLPIISNTIIEKLTESLEAYLTQDNSSDPYLRFPSLDGFLERWNLMTENEIEKEEGGVFFGEFLNCFREVCQSTEKIAFIFSKEYAAYQGRKKFFTEYMQEKEVDFPRLNKLDAIGDFFGESIEQKAIKEIIKNSILEKFKLFVQYRSLPDKLTAIANSLSTLLKKAKDDLENYQEKNKTEEFFEQPINPSHTNVINAFRQLDEMVSELSIKLKDSTIYHDLSNGSFFQRFKKGFIFSQTALQKLYSAWCYKNLLTKDSVKQQLLAMPWYKLLFNYGIICLPWKSAELLDKLAHNIVTETLLKKLNDFYQQPLIKDSFNDLTFEEKEKCIKPYLGRLKDLVEDLKKIEANKDDRLFLISFPTALFATIKEKINVVQKLSSTYREFCHKYPMQGELEENQQYKFLAKQQEQLNFIAQCLSEVSDLVKRESDPTLSIVEKNPLVKSNIGCKQAFFPRCCSFSGDTILALSLDEPVNFGPSI